MSFFFTTYLYLQAFGSTVTFDNRAVIDNADVLLLAVKPNVVQHVLELVRPYFTPKHLLLSVAMGVTVNQLEKVRTVLCSCSRAVPYSYFFFTLFIPSPPPVKYYNVVKKCL